MAQKRKKNKKLIFWMVMVILFVVAAVVCYFVWANYFGNKNEDEAIGGQNLVIDRQEEKVETAIEGTVEVGKEKVVQYEGEDPNTQEELTGVVTYAGVNDGNLMIRVNIDQYLDSGSCELNLVQDVVAYGDVANIVGGATTAICEGFNVPLNGLAGDYQIVIKINSGDKTGTIRGEVNI